MGTVIITRPTAATKQFVATVASNSTGPTIAHMYELANKTELTEAEANWLKHKCTKYMIETVPA